MLMHITPCFKVTGRLCGASLCLMLLFPSFPAAAADRAGDEFLQRVNPPERVNLSYETIELIASREWRGWRVSVGGEYLIHKEPDDLKPISAHWGGDYRGSKPLVWNGRPIVGVDMKSFEEHNGTIDTSVKAGLEFGHPNPGQRHLRLMAEWHKGCDRTKRSPKIPCETADELLFTLGACA
jgi:hypothetical protein